MRSPATRKYISSGSLPLIPSAAPCTSLSIRASNKWMRRFIKWVSLLVGLLAMFVAYRLVVLTQTGEMIWFVLDGRAKLIEDGMQVKGWLHREWRGQALIITRKGGPVGRESYLVAPGRRGGRFVEGCDGWTAMRLPVFPFLVSVSDALPCPGWRLPEHPKLYGTAILSSGSLEFVDERGRRLQVRWQ